MSQESLGLFDALEETESSEPVAAEPAQVEATEAPAQAEAVDEEPEEAAEQLEIAQLLDPPRTCRRPFRIGKPLLTVIEWPATQHWFVTASGM